ncbi:class I SAM-dependent methyltransferase [Microbacterium saccharophilum]|uniref:Class I SAM-dependent methyltransferase n=1 Tax=Microbacterium saccharophilum TaxID=1213358 RepID=A0A5C8I5B3_9MICO|nr:class I SAM-dependent methyltransferase [Microbacterium saccharophilum]TXK14228.1 class I SAM-dependent methyltransferase [Microbacterium saccharophilum]GEP46789.1 putative methyltransferase [Microbacterium saccharophilum]
MVTSDREMSTSFGRAAGAYEQGRPEYPSAAVTWMLAPAARDGRATRVADVGAGTGKLTRALVELGAEVVAVDPDPEMLAALRGAVRGVPTFTGTAEQLPLPEASVDAVVLGQAWHWVEPVAASAEVARVLRAGGVLGLIWNIRDESVPWVARLTAIMQGSNAEKMLAAGDPPVAAPFTGLEAQEWRWSRPMTRATLTAMVRSRSYIITAGEEERARIDRGIAELFDDIGAVGDAAVELPYVTRAYRAVRP